MSAALKLIATIALRSLAIARSPPPRCATPQTSSRGEKLGERSMSWLGKLEQARAEIASRNIDPWRLPLERLHGKIDDDGIERITTQTLFDILSIEQHARGAGACRR